MELLFYEKRLHHLWLFRLAKSQVRGDKIEVYVGNIDRETFSSHKVERWGVWDR